MYSAIEIASCICARYKIKYGKRIDEMKLHKLLYFVQRESFVQTNEPLFPEQFEAWKFGPVMVDIRHHYKVNDFPDCNIDATTNRIINDVLEEYSGTRSWSLSMMSHEEISWQNARKGIPDGENGNNEMSTEDIKFDAERVKKMRGAV